MTAMRTLLGIALGVFSSLGTSCVLLILLGLLTWLGTLEQVHTGLFEVQKKYFESFVLLHDFGPLSLPLPGANLVLCLLFVNLTVGGIVRIRKNGATAGVLIAHAGILLLLVAGFVKNYFADEGHVTLFEGQRANHFQSYYLWEIAVQEPLGDGRVREHVVPGERFSDATGAQSVTLTTPALPFDIEVHHFMRNAEPMPKGPKFDVAVPVVDGVFLRDVPMRTEAEANIAGAYATVVHRDGRREAAILWGAQTAPWTIADGNKQWAIDLRKRRYPMPFTLVLDDFRKEDHPRLDMPKSFSSDVEVVEGASSRPVTISMNEPLRAGGLVLYQASWGPSNARPGQPLFSTFAVVRNPADQYPLIACIVIAAGLVLHFSRKLVRHIRLEAARS